jgi:hypothetical protein
VRVRPIELHVTLTSVLHPDDRASIERVAKAFAVPAGAVRDIPGVLVGTGSDLLDELRHRRSTHGFSYVTVSDEIMEKFAPVVGELAGGR